MSIRRLTRIAAFAAVMCALTFVSVPLPFSPVPITGQTLGVMIAGGLLGARDGPVAIFTYLVLGIIGLPVFSGGRSGPAMLAGPTGGFLWGFIPGAFITGLIAHARKRLPAWKVVGGLLLGGVILVDACGVVQLSLVTGLPLRHALTVGVIPFIPGDMLKVAAAAFLLQRQAIRHAASE